MASIKYKNGSSWNDLLLDIIYPIGSVYITADIQSPSSLFGGTWSQVQGSFVRGYSKPPATAGSAESKTGGEDSHVITQNELPNVTASFIMHGAGAGLGSNMDVVSGTMVANARTVSKYIQGGSATLAGANSVVSFDLVLGKNSSHNNMPVYRNFYVYERTA